MWRDVLFVLAATVPAIYPSLAAQCADGSPPPCGSSRRQVSTPPSNSIAVLYFDNLTRDSAYSYLADGLTEDLIALLGRVARLEVRSRYESARLRGKRGLIPSNIRRELNVAYLVGGSVQPGTGRIRVNAELIETRSGRRVWGDRLTVLATDPLAVQESITTAVVQAVIGQLLPEERAFVTRRATRDSAAYDLYLRGRFFVGRLTEYDIRQGLALYKEALTHDSTFALAWAETAYAWTWLADNWVGPLEAFTHVREAAERALALDSSVAPASMALSFVAQQIDRDFVRAEALARRAIALDPRLADAHAVLSWVLVTRGLPGEALMESERAWQLDSLSITIRQVRMSTLLMVGRVNDVLAHARSLRWTTWELNALVALGQCAEAQDLLRDSKEGLRQDFKVELDFELNLWYYSALVAGCLGDMKKGRAALDSLVVLARGAFVPSITFATIHAALGDVDEAFSWLERANEERNYNLLFINIPFPWFASVRADARFIPLIRRLGLPWPAPRLSN